MKYLDQFKESLIPRPPDIMLRSSPSPLTSFPAFLEHPCPPKLRTQRGKGVFDDMEFPGTAGNDVRGLRDALGNFTKMIAKIRQQ